MLVDDLGWLGRELTEARESEALERALLDATHSLPGAPAHGPIAAHVSTTLECRHAEGRARAVAALDSDRYLQLQRGLDQLLTRPLFADRADRSVRKELQKGIGRTWRRTASRVEAALAVLPPEPPGASRVEALNKAANAAERLVYAIEITQPTLGEPAENARRAVERLHTVLGTHRDAVRAEAALRALAVQAQGAEASDSTYGFLIADQRSVPRAPQSDGRRQSANGSHPSHTAWDVADPGGRRG